MPGNRVKRKLAYTQETLDEALQGIRNNTLTYREAAELYGIPRSTLSDRITGKRGWFQSLFFNTFMELYWLRMSFCKGFSEKSKIFLSIIMQHFFYFFLF